MVPFVPPATDGKVGGSSLLDRLMILVQRSFDSLARVVTNDRLIRVVVTTSGTPVIHGLGYPITSWEIVRMAAPGALVWEAAIQPNPRQALTLVASADVAVTVRVT